MYIGDCRTGGEATCLGACALGKLSDQLVTQCLSFEVNLSGLEV